MPPTGHSLSSPAQRLHNTASRREGPQAASRALKGRHRLTGSVAQMDESADASYHYIRESSSDQKTAAQPDTRRLCRRASRSLLCLANVSSATDMVRIGQRYSTGRTGASEGQPAAQFRQDQRSAVRFWARTRQIRLALAQTMISAITVVNRKAEAATRSARSWKSPQHAASSTRNAGRTRTRLRLPPSLQRIQ